MLQNLSRLSRVATRKTPGAGDVAEACEIVRRALDGAEAYIICGGDPNFTRLGSDSEPDQYEIKQRGYWLVWRELATDESRFAGAFTVQERLVTSGSEVERGPYTHVGCILAAEESNSELLIVRGPWPKGLSEEQRYFLEAARPILASLVSKVIDGSRHARQQEQLKGLSEVARAFNEASEVDNVLQAVATALAKASGFDWAQVTVVNDEGDAIVERAINLSRYSDTETVAMGLRQNQRYFLVVKQLAATRKPMLRPDVFDPALNLEQELLAYYQRAHILSTAVFPMVFQDRLLGSVSYSSHTRRALDELEVAFLADLTSQAATTIKGMRLYKQLEEASRIQHFLARTDALTGVPNRRYIEEVLKAECARAQRYSEPVSLVMADLDHFKDINDGIGHDSGDEALKHVASIARDNCREADFVGRWGGDEFLFILPLTALEGGLVFAERFRSTLAGSRFVPRGRSAHWPMTVSAGVAQAGDATYANPEQLFRLADTALYAAKESGRDRVMAAHQREAAA